MHNPISTFSRWRMFWVSLNVNHVFLLPPCLRSMHSIEQDNKLGTSFFPIHILHFRTCKNAILTNGRNSFPPEILALSNYVSRISLENYSGAATTNLIYNTYWIKRTISLLTAARGEVVHEVTLIEQYLSNYHSYPSYSTKSMSCYY